MIENVNEHEERACGSILGIDAAVIGLVVDTVNELEQVRAGVKNEA